MTQATTTALSTPPPPNTMATPTAPRRHVSPVEFESISPAEFESSIDDTVEGSDWPQLASVIDDAKEDGLAIQALMVLLEVHAREEKLKEAELNALFTHVEKERRRTRQDGRPHHGRKNKFEPKCLF